MVEISSVVDFDDLTGHNEEDSKFKKYLDGLKDDVHKGAFFVRKKDGRYAFGCTEESKVGQERLLYHLKNTIEFYIDKYPDFDEMKESAELYQISEQEVLEEMYDLDDDDDDE